MIRRSEKKVVTNQLFLKKRMNAELPTLKLKVKKRGNLEIFGSLLYILTRCLEFYSAELASNCLKVFPQNLTLVFVPIPLKHVKTSNSK